VLVVVFQIALQLIQQLVLVLMHHQEVLCLLF
jgi:hypothetical protein